MDYRYKHEWQFKKYNHIKITKDKTIVNTKTDRILKRVVRGYSVGYNIVGNFIILSKINDHVEKIKYERFPF